MRATGPLGNERLSDERTITRWSHPWRRAPVRSAPSLEGETVARLRHRTEDGMPEVYILLRSRIDADGRTWLKIRVPKRPNGATGWVRRGDMTTLNVVRTHLRVDPSRLRAVLHDRGREVWRARAGIGKPSTPTPRGRFWIRERLKGLGGIYGPWAIGTSAYSVLSDWPGGGVIGLHGTNQPWLIPGRPSHGCIRLRNAKIRRLVKLAPIGTPVQIR